MNEGDDMTEPFSQFDGVLRAMPCGVCGSDVVVKQLPESDWDHWVNLWAGNAVEFRCHGCGLPPVRELCTADCTSDCACSPGESAEVNT